MEVTGHISSSDSSYYTASEDDDWISNPASQSALDDKISDVDFDAEDRASEEEESSDDSDVTESQELVEPSSSANIVVAEDGTVWNKIRPTHHQTPSHNIRQRSGPHQSTKDLSICDTFKCIFPDEMIDVILKHTNEKAKQSFEAYNNINPTKKQLEWTNVTVREFDAFLGLLITSGVNHSNALDTLDMWKTNSNPLYRASMSINRFRNILRFLRFDDANTRKGRINKAASIRNLWTMLNSNLRKYYRPTKNLTVGEQLSCRTEFTQHIPSKPAKYGIKVWWICDAENYYPLTGQIYIEKASTESTCREQNEGERAAMELVVPYEGSRRNITMDKFFTTPTLANYLLSCKLTIVGTLKKDEPFISRQMAPSNFLQISTTTSGFQENVKICSYEVKRKKAVVLLSTMHHDTVTSGEREESEIFYFFNKTKSAVNVMDKLLVQYTTCRTNRWPVAFFYNILDIAAFAAYIINMANYDFPSNGSFMRSIFLRQLGEGLCLPMIQHRSQNVQIMRNFSSRTSIECMLGSSVDIIDETTSASTSTATIVRDQAERTKVIGVCYICSIEKIRKLTNTRKVCVDCIQPICDEHSETFNKCKICQNK